LTNLELRQKLEAVLSCPPNLIGTYTLPNGQAIPAIYMTGTQGVPADWKVQGLEVTMEEMPRRSPMAGVGIVVSRMAWVVMLVNYNGGTNALDQAVSRLERVFPDATFSPSPETDIAYGQYRIVIPDVQVRPVLRP
jgi:hypothetical protein